MAYVPVTARPAGQEICSGCMKPFHDGESHFHWGDCIVCKRCHDRLSHSKANQHCSNCRRTINPLEKPYHWAGRMVCGQCMEMLKSSSPAKRPYTCDNCGRVIGKLEQPYQLHGHIVCPRCQHLKSAPHVHVPVHALRHDKHPPLIKYVATTILSLLIVIVLLMLLAYIKVLRFGH